MNYDIDITEAAQRDFENIYTYISENLCNKKAALDLINLLNKNVQILTAMPEIYPIVRDEYLGNMGIRFITVKNYMIFYVVNKSENQVSIIRVLYGKRNWTEIL